MPWDMIGHDWAVHLLQQHVASGKVRHAYLFAGPDGVGKRTLALRFAQALCCEAAPQAGGFCGTCRACRLIADQQHPDLHVVASESPGAALRVGQVRELQKMLSLAPYEARWRIALMLRFHEATASASNALLKTLEEPAERVVLLLGARTVEELLPTIVSRCEILRLRCLSTPELENALKARGELGDEAGLVAALAAGRPGWAIKFGKDPEWMQTRKQRLDDLTAILQMTRSDRFKQAEKLAKDGESLNYVLETWLAWWRDAVLASLETEASLNNPDRISDFERIRSKVATTDLLKALRITEQTLEALNRNANPRLALENLMLDLPHA
jgi:DNA polymerase-3 subunit delta'